MLTFYTGIWLVMMGIVEIVWGLQMRNDSKNLREVGDVVREHVYAAKKAS